MMQETLATHSATKDSNLSTLKPSIMLDHNVIQMCKAVATIEKMWRFMAKDLHQDLNDKGNADLSIEVTLFEDAFKRQHLKLSCIHTRPNKHSPGDTSSYSVGDVIVNEDGEMTFCGNKADHEGAMCAIICNSPSDDAYKRTMMQIVIEKDLFFQAESRAALKYLADHAKTAKPQAQKQRVSFSKSTL